VLRPVMATPCVITYTNGAMRARDLTAFNMAPSAILDFKIFKIECQVTSRVIRSICILIPNFAATGRTVAEI